MKKIVAIIIGIILIVGVSYFFWERSNTQPLGEVTEGMLNENEAVEKIVITNRVIDSQNFQEEAVLDENLFESIITEVSNINLRQQQDSPGIRYIIDIETDQGNRHTIYTNEDDMHINDYNYQVVGENYLVNFIDSSDLEWE